MLINQIELSSNYIVTSTSSDPTGMHRWWQTPDITQCYTKLNETFGYMPPRNPYTVNIPDSDDDTHMPTKNESGI